MNREKIQCLILWGVVAYAVAILIYFTLKAFNHSVDSISAFGSILSAIATFFATAIAILIFKEWKKQARYIDNIKTITNILAELKTLFLHINNVQKYSEHLNHFTELRSAILTSRAYKQDDTGLLPVEERIRKIQDFNSNLSPIKNSRNIILENLDMLSVFNRINLENQQAAISELVSSVLSDLNHAYKTIVLYHVGCGTIPNSEFEKEFDDKDLHFALTILNPHGTILKKDMKEDKIKKFEKHFKQLEGVDGELYVFYTNDVIIDNKTEILKIIEDIRIKYIE